MMSSRFVCTALLGRYSDPSLRCLRECAAKVGVMSVRPCWSVRWCRDGDDGEAFYSLCSSGLLSDIFQNTKKDELICQRVQRIPSNSTDGLLARVAGHNQ